MLIDNTEIHFTIDEILKKVHILDLDKYGRRSLTNAIDPGFQAKIIQKIGLAPEVLEYEWICYGMDGIVASYQDYNFKFRAYDVPYLHKPYLDVMGERRSRFRHSHNS